VVVAKVKVSAGWLLQDIEKSSLSAAKSVEFLEQFSGHFKAFHSHMIL